MHSDPLSTVYQPPVNQYNKKAVIGNAKGYSPVPGSYRVGYANGKPIVHKVGELTPRDNITGFKRAPLNERGAQATLTPRTKGNMLYN